MTVIDDIKARLDLVDEIGRKVKLDRTGKNYKGFCPFHTNIHTESFIVFPGTRTWKCFGQCDEGGDIFSFFMKLNGWAFEEALQELAKQAGVELRPLSKEEQTKIELKREREQVLAAAAKFFQAKMGVPTPEEGKEETLPEKPSLGLEYALERGFTLETLRASGTGYFDGDWDGLRQHLSDAGIDLLIPGSGGADRLARRREQVGQGAQPAAGESLGRAAPDTGHAAAHADLPAHLCAGG